MKTISYFKLAALVFILSSCRFIRMRDEKAASEFQERNSSPRFIRTRIDGLSLHYVKVGSDSLGTLFFVHGSPGSWKAFEAYLMDKELQQRFRIIAIDRPGFGYSSPGNVYSLDEQSKLIYTIIKREQNGKPFHLIGHSLGGPVIVKLAQEHPEAFASLTILAGSISPLDEPRERWRLLLIHSPLQYLLPGFFRVCNAEIWSFKKSLWAMDPYYDKLNMPVTVIHGDKDPLVSIKNTDYAKGKLSFNKRLKIIIIPGANHFIPREHFGLVKSHLLSLPLK